MVSLSFNCVVEQIIHFRLNRDELRIWIFLTFSYHNIRTWGTSQHTIWFSCFYMPVFALEAFLLFLIIIFLFAHSSLFFFTLKVKWIGQNFLKYWVMHNNENYAHQTDYHRSKVSAVKSFLIPPVIQEIKSPHQLLNLLENLILPTNSYVVKVF